jgi:ribosome maturation factor RimP
LEPLVERRQFPKHVGELMQVELKDGQKLKGSLELVDEGSVELRWKERVPKEIGKGKRTVEIRRTIPFEEIETAKRTVNFKA